MRGDGLQPAGEGDEGGDSPLFGHSVDRLGFDGDRHPRECVHPSWRHPGKIERTRFQRAYLPQPAQCPHQFRSADAGRSLPEPAEGGLPCAGFDCQKAFQPSALIFVGKARERAVESPAGTVPHSDHQPEQHRRPWQQHLFLHEPSGPQVEEHAQALGGELRPSVESAQQAEVLRLTLEKVLLTCLSYLVVGGNFYVVFVSSLTYGTEQLGLERNTMLALTLISSAVSFFGLLFFGHLSDRVGRKRRCRSFAEDGHT